MIHAWLCRLAELPPIVEVLLKATVLLAGAWVLHFLVRRCNPYWRVLLWRGLGMAVVATPLLVMLAPSIPIALPAPPTASPAAVTHTDGFARFAGPETERAGSSLAEPLPKGLLPNASPSPEMLDAAPSALVRAGTWIAAHAREALLVLWVAGVLVLVSRWAVAWVRLRRVIAASVPAGDPEQRCLRRVAAALECHEPVRLRIAEHVPGPLLAGIRRPTILLPRRMNLKAEDGELAAVLAHELMHVYNHDLLWMAFLRALAIVFWWHPLAWLPCRAHGRACEEASDATAAQFVGDRAAYARTLARVALSSLAPSPTLAGVLMARPAEIMRRLSRLAGRADAPRPRMRRAAPAGLLGAAAAAALSGLQLVGAAPATAPASKPATAAARVLHFPADRSLGRVSIQDANLRREITSFYWWTEDGVSDQWEELGPARGDVSIPAGKRVRLWIGPEGWEDLSPLDKLRPDDLYGVCFEGTGMSAEDNEVHGFLQKGNAGDPVMPHVARLTGLKNLNLSYTEVTSDGLRHIERLTALECFCAPRRIDDRGMTSVAKLTGLKRLYFKENEVTSAGLAALGQLKELEELELGGEKMDDQALAHLKMLPRLYYLSLWSYHFTDAGMKYLKNAPSLRILILFDTKNVTDAGLADVAKVATLERLSMPWMSHISDKGIAHLAHLPALRQLDLSHTGMSDVGAGRLQSLNRLERLELPDGLSQEALVALLAAQPRLRHLWYRGTSNSTYGDEVLEAVGKMSDLEELSACGKHVTDAGLTFLRGCRKLRRLSLFFCPITDRGLAEIGRLKSLRQIEIIQAKLTTAGLKELNGLNQLTDLDVSDVTPAKAHMDLSGLTSLRDLAFRGKPLRDADLACLEKLKNLERLQLCCCRGLTDAGLAHLAGLTKLSLLSIGDQIDDAGLAYLKNMKHLSSLNISGPLTKKGLLALEQNPALSFLTVITPEDLGEDIADELSRRLPRLVILRAGPDLNHMQPLQFRASAARRSR